MEEMSSSESSAPPANLTPLNRPSEGIPEVINTPAGLRRAVRTLREGSGALAVDTERASGFRYGQRAFLIQIRRPGAGTWLIDPEAFEDLEVLQEFMNEQSWILHAASQDLPCLHELGLYPVELYDTELAGRLAGMPRVGLGTMVAELLGIELAKEHSAVDWSTRPLPESWLSYAALDVEVLHELRDAIAKVLEEQGKTEYARQEFEFTRTMPDPQPADEPWRKLPGLARIKRRKQLAVARELWLARDALARSRDVAPGKLLNDKAIMATLPQPPRTVPALLQINGFHGRSAKRDAPRWLEAIGRGLASTDLPEPSVNRGMPQNVRSWGDKNPKAAERLGQARQVLAELSEQVQIPTENLLTPRFLRQLCWDASDGMQVEAVAEFLRHLGAREWQIELVATPLAEALSS